MDESFTVLVESLRLRGLRVVMSDFFLSKKRDGKRFETSLKYPQLQSRKPVDGNDQFVWGLWLDGYPWTIQPASVMDVHNFDEKVFITQHILLKVDDDGLHGIVLKRDLTVEEVVCTLDCMCGAVTNTEHRKPQQEQTRAYAAVVKKQILRMFNGFDFEKGSIDDTFITGDPLTTACPHLPHTDPMCDAQRRGRSTRQCISRSARRR